jgi:hypothetical protein
MVSCEGILNLEILGDGNIVAPVKRNLSDFNEIEFYDAFELEVRDSDFHEVYVQADSNLLRYISTEVNDERLTIQRLPNYAIYPRKPIRVIVYTPDINLIDVYGNGHLIIDSLDVDKLELNVYSRATMTMRDLEIGDFSVLSNSGGNLQLAGQFRNLLFRQAGSGHAIIAGSAQKAKIIQEGSGIVEGQTFFTDEIAVSLFGSGLIYFNSENNSTVKIDGNGRVYYSGSKPSSYYILGSGQLIENGN